jgi:hypothetical protein
LLQAFPGVSSDAHVNARQRQWERGPTRLPSFGAINRRAL